MNLKYAILFFACMLLAPIAKAQVSFTAEASKTVLGANERLRIDFIMTKDGDHFVPPNFDDFMIIAGPSQTTSASWVNGKSSYRKTFSYYLQPKTTGTFTIGVAKITIDGKVYTTKPIEINVTDAVANGRKSTESIVQENIHVVAIISNQQPYLNEGITVEYRLYVSNYISVADYDQVEVPTFSSFWNKDIRFNSQKVQKGTYKGEDYRYVVLRKKLLYPQKTGEIEIPPLKINVLASVPTNQFTMYGKRRYKRLREVISSGVQTIRVQALPSANRPASFTGAVGNFDFEVIPTKTKLKAGESLQLKVKVSGKGNLELFDIPKITVPSALELYDPEHSEKIHNNGASMYGSIVDNYTVVPKTQGKFPIPSIEFSYFDPDSETYKTVRSKELIIEVEGNGQVVPFGDTTIATTPKQTVTSKKEFRYIKLDANLEPIERIYFWNSVLFWSLLVLPFIFIPLAIFLGKKQEARANDVVGNRSKKADKLARKYLSEAKRNLGEHKAFYDALESALHNYLKAKLRLQTSEMSKEHIRKLLSEHGVSDENTLAFSSLLKNCEFARYTPTSATTMNEDYLRAAKLISGLDKQLK